MNKLNDSPHGEAVRHWQAFGFENTIYDEENDALAGPVPAGVVAFCAFGAEQIRAQQRSLQNIGTVPALSAAISSNQHLYLYKLDKDLSIEAIKEHFGSASLVRGEGDYITLPSGDHFTPQEWPETVDGLSVLDTLEPYLEPDEESPCDDLPTQISEGTLLDEFSIRDANLGEEVHCLPLLGGVVMSGQATTVYAKPNTGKTLLMMYLVKEAVAEGHLHPSRTYVINADDSLEGVQGKRALLAEAGIHMIVPGKQGFESAKLLTTMREMIERDQCREVLIVVDTLKKFVDLMDKRNAADFGNIVRQFVLAGGTFFALAHTRKNEGADGNPVYTGTTDIVEDFDATCMLAPLSERGAEGEKLVQFQFFKRRGGNVDQTFAFDDDPNISYQERLSSVRLVEANELREQVTYAQFKSDEPIIQAIRRSIYKGTVQKMSLAKAVAEETGKSRQAVLDVLDRYTGKNPSNDLWFYTVGERGAKVFQAHPEPEDVEE